MTLKARSTLSTKKTDSQTQTKGVQKTDSQTRKLRECLSSTWISLTVANKGRDNTFHFQVRSGCPKKHDSATPRVHETHAKWHARENQFRAGKERIWANDKFDRPTMTDRIIIELCATLSESAPSSAMTGNPTIRPSHNGFGYIS